MKVQILHKIIHMTISDNLTVQIPITACSADDWGLLANGCTALACRLSVGMIGSMGSVIIVTQKKKVHFRVNDRPEIILDGAECVAAFGQLEVAMRESSAGLMCE
jgi:hypothetical protein